MHLHLPIDLHTRYEQHKHSGDDWEVAVDSVCPVDVKQAVILLPYSGSEQQTVATANISKYKIKELLTTPHPWSTPGNPPT